MLEKPSVVLCFRLTTAKPDVRLVLLNVLKNGWTPENYSGATVGPMRTQTEPLAHHSLVLATPRLISAISLVNIVCEELPAVI